jgi:Mycothiol maleylpyruvate isomerase N-terminal domain/MDMPI C-terminal domain
MTQEQPYSTARPSSHGRALLAAIDALPSSAPTACTGWRAHEIVAHLTAGAKEIADLIEESIAGHPPRPTRGFEEREAPFRAMPHDQLRDRLVAENRRKLAAYAALRARTENPAITFTGTRITAAELDMHSRSEAAIHRWDLVGDDETSGSLLTQSDLTVHAVKVLNRMPVLNESAHSSGMRATAATTQPIQVVFRTPGHPDVVLVASRDGGRLQVSDRPVDGDATLTTDAANRLLVLWGRRSSGRTIVTDGDPAIIQAFGAVFWPKAQPMAAHRCRA